MIFIEEPKTCYHCTSNSDDVNDQSCFVVQNDTKEYNDLPGLLKKLEFSRNLILFLFKAYFFLFNTAKDFCVIKVRRYKITPAGTTKFQVVRHWEAPETNFTEDCIYEKELEKELEKDGNVNVFTSDTICYCRGHLCNNEEVNMKTGVIEGRRIVEATTTTTTTTTKPCPKNGATSSNWSHGGIFMLIVSTGIMMNMIVW